MSHTPRTSAERRALAERERALCARAQDGDVAAMEELIERFQPKIRGVAAGYFAPGAERADLEQEGMIGLVQAIRGYDAGRGIPFYAFAETCISRAVMGAVRKATRESRRAQNEALSLEWGEESGASLTATLADDDTDAPERRAIAREGMSILARACEDELTALELRVLALHLEGVCHADIAADLDRSVKAVDNALQRIRRKVGAHLAAWDPQLVRVPAPRRS